MGVLFEHMTTQGLELTRTSVWVLRGVLKAVCTSVEIPETLRRVPENLSNITKLGGQELTSCRCEYEDFCFWALSYAAYVDSRCAFGRVRRGDGIYRCRSHASTILPEGHNVVLTFGDKISDAEAP